MVDHADTMPSFPISPLMINCLSHSLREALAPFLKQEEERHDSENATKLSPFQYVLCAPTSPAVKQQEETLTYLNQGRYMSTLLHV